MALIAYQHVEEPELLEEKEESVVVGVIAEAA